MMSGGISTTPAESARGSASSTTLSIWRNRPCSFVAPLMYAGSCSIALSAAAGFANSTPLSWSRVTSCLCSTGAASTGLAGAVEPSG